MREEDADVSEISQRILKTNNSRTTRVGSVCICSIDPSALASDWKTCHLNKTLPGQGSIPISLNSAAAPS